MNVRVCADRPPRCDYQDATAGAVAATAKGCVWNMDVDAMLQEAGVYDAAREVRVTPQLLGTVTVFEVDLK